MVLKEAIERTDALLRDIGVKGEIVFRAPILTRFLPVAWVLAKRDRVHVMGLDIPDGQVPLLYVCLSMGMAPTDHSPLQQNCQAYLYPINLRLILHREQVAFPDLTMTATESLIREGIKYVLDRSKFLHMEGIRPGYEINSWVIDHVEITRSTLEGFMAPWNVYDYELAFIVSEQATLAANPYN